jgi:hypothetical protein
VGDDWHPNKNSRHSEDFNWFDEALNSIVLRPGVINNNFATSTNSQLLMETNCTNFAEYMDQDFESNDGSSIQNFGGTNVYGNLVPKFHQICDLMQDSTDQEITNRGFDSILHDLLQRKHKATENSDGTIQMRSMPEIAKGPYKRKAPSGSPSKWKGKGK